ncbi:MAG TPA: hypothetical protein VFA95_06090 [Gammaproteobacteria bacterium]|nr:hypothetical protein [Gammaproteobacteria bacterium]
MSQATPRQLSPRAVALGIVRSTLLGILLAVPIVVSGSREVPAPAPRPLPGARRGWLWWWP